MATPHISSGSGEIAPTVLMPGDPLRAAHIAENFLEAPKLVNQVRGMTGFTGTYQGHPVSVIPSGMGMPSAAIYITELARFYGVTRIIRVGTTGAFQPDLELRSIVAAESATTNSNLAAVVGAPAQLVAAPALLGAAQTAADQAGLSLRTGPVFTSDVFYEPESNSTVADQTAAGTLCVEMEAAALYALAATENFEALALLTVTDHLATGEQLSSAERQTGVDEMLALGLTVALA